MEVENQEIESDLEFDKAFNELATGTTPEQLDAAEAESSRLRDDQGRFTAEPKEEEGEIEEQQSEQKATETTEEAQGNINWEHMYKSDQGRQSALQTKLAESERIIQELRSGQPSQKPAEIPNEQWEELKTDYPEIAAGIEAKFGDMAKNHQAEIEALKGQISPIQQEAQAQYEKSQIDALLKDFPDYVETIRTLEFDQWIVAQPKAVQALMASDEAVDASYLLSSFAQSQQNTQPQEQSPLREKRKQQLADAETLSGRNTQKQAVDEDDFDAAFNEFAD